MHRIILTAAMFGVLLFGAAFAVSFSSPATIERAARELLRIEVQRQVGEKIDTLSNSRIVGLAQRALGKTNADVEKSAAQLKSGAAEKVASVIADLLQADCQCRARLALYANESALHRFNSLLQVQTQLTELIERAYANVAQSLIKEFRIFTGANALVFIALFLIARKRSQAQVQLVLPALILIGAAAITASLYLFQQNWLHTIVFNDYVGFAYFAYLGISIVLLWDIALNRARLSSWLINQGASAIGSSFQVLPC